ncbi:phage holin family protein [Algoriphagus confluentis]|uniref:Phage holin family protein n=1 Tax=Algoriphagus confluentis TaxID=1697556 RepID=A0ABQ6PLV0_9BACT|nr:hypothetical protein Aconfl_15990 [Algoriphagus confluentis]
MINVGEIIKTLRGIVEARIGLIKEEIQEEFFGFLSRLILLVIIGSLLLLVFLFLSLSLAFFLSQLTQSPYLGFLIVALMYLLTVLVLYLSRDSLKLRQRTEGALKNFFTNIKNEKISDE